MSKHLFLFNPDCELAIANGSPFYMPPANIIRMVDDLAWLPACLAEEGDYILAGERPDVSFLETMGGLLGYECKPVVWDDLQGLEIKAAEPWGWSPKACRQFSAYGLSQEWTDGRKELYSRKKAREVLVELIRTLPFMESAVVPQICFSVDEIARNAGEGAWLAKAPWSSSGKGLLALNGGVCTKEREWLSGMLRRQGYLMLERRLDKVFDFAMEFRLEGKAEMIGLSAFKTGEAGEYKGNYIGGQEWIEERLHAYVGKDCLGQIKEELIRILSEWTSAYHGYLGVDMMVYRDFSGNYRIQPCVEINLRYNMGIVALFLSRKCLAEGVQGTFSINYFPNRGEAEEHRQSRLKQNPLIIDNKRIVRGYLNITSIKFDTHFVADVEIG